MATARTPLLLAILTACAGCGVKAQAPVDIQSVAGSGAVKAGQTFDTPCFSVTAPVDSYGASNGCRYRLAMQSLGAGTAPGVPYFDIEVLTSNSLLHDGAPLAQKMQKLLDAIRQANAAHPAVAGLARGPYDTDAGGFDGVTRTTVDGHPAVEANWTVKPSPNAHRVCVSPLGAARDCSASPTQKAIILVDIPPPGFLWNNRPSDVLMITGYPQGYRSAAFRGALQATKLKFAAS